MSSDFYLEQVEMRKHEDKNGMWWIDESAGRDPLPNASPGLRPQILEGPYTEEEIDKILWERAIAGDFMPGEP